MCRQPGVTAEPPHSRRGCPGDQREDRVQGRVAGYQAELEELCSHCTRCAATQPCVMDGTAQRLQMFPFLLPELCRPLAAGEHWGNGAVAAVSLPAWLLSAVALFGCFHWRGKDPGQEAEPAIQTPASISFSVLGSLELCSLELRDSQAFILCYLSALWNEMKSPPSSSCPVLPLTTAHCSHPPWAHPAREHSLNFPPCCSLPPPLCFLFFLPSTVCEKLSCFQE